MINGTSGSWMTIRTFDAAVHDAGLAAKQQIRRRIVPPIELHQAERELLTPLFYDAVSTNITHTEEVIKRGVLTQFAIGIREADGHGNWVYGEPKAREALRDIVRRKGSRLEVENKLT